MNWDQILQLVEQGTLDEAFRSCGAQGSNIRRIDPHAADEFLGFVSGNVTSEQKPRPQRAIGSPLDGLIETKLEQWLVEHWHDVDFGENFQLYRENDEEVGQQYDTREVGVIDLFCEDVDTNDLVVIELKRGRQSEVVAGQLARYIGWTEGNLGDVRRVRGIILAPDFDSRIRYAARAIPGTLPLKYETRFEIRAG